MASRRRLLAVATAAATTSLVVGFVSARQIQSPQDAAAQAAPPEASRVTASVERRVLTSQIITRGDAAFAGAENVSVETGALDMPPVVTGRVPSVGDTIDEGMPALEVVGRPVIMLGGGLPTYRTLAPGSAGPDVRQLEDALIRLGFDPGEVDDSYDAATAAAVEQLYQHAGYAPPAVSEDVQQRVDTAHRAVASAQQQLEAATQALRSAEAGVPESQRLSAEAQVAAAARAVQHAKSLRAQHAADTRTAEQELQAAQEELDAARASSDEGQSEASTDTEAAAASRRKAARDRVVDARARLDSLDAMDPDGELTAAESQLAIARANRDELLAPPDTSALGSAVADAERELAAAHTELADAETRAGTPLPASEVVFVSTLPRLVDEVAVERGALVEGPAMTVSGADLVINVTVTDADAGLLSTGLPASLQGPGATLDATVTALRQGEQGNTMVEITPDELGPSDASELRGANVKVTIPIDSTDGDVLVVPLAALTAGADGTSRVEVATRPGDTELVEVDVGLATDGFAEVVAADGALEAGDLVVVGQ